MDKTERLIEEILLFKRAWIVSVAWLGQKVGPEYLTSPNYSTWPIKELKREIQKVQDDFSEGLNHILIDRNKNQIKSVARWFADKCVQWKQSGNPIFSLGRVQEAERVIGCLRADHPMEFPPYAELVLQGFGGLAVRHPEYHLAHDLVLLHNLFLDSEALAKTGLAQGKKVSSESNQSLARSVIITCYNLLESFVSGLVVAWSMENQKPIGDIFNKLRRKDQASLKERFIEVPSIIVSGKTGLIDGSKSPFHPLFNDFKRRRDSFVHCEPGSQPNKFGNVKEKAFHDVEVFAVEKTVDYTLEAICIAWMMVHGREKPHWLPVRGPSGRLPRADFRLAIDPDFARHSIAK